MNITLDKKILGAFIICSITLLIVGAFSFRNSARVTASNKLVSRTHQVIHELDQILMSSVNCETGARGFVITGEEAYLEPFKDSRSKLFEHIEKARELTLDTKVQTYIDKAAQLSTNLIRHLEKKIELRKKNFELAKEMVLTGKGKSLQDDLRNVIGAAKQMELQLLADRTTLSERENNNFNEVFITLMLIILMALVINYYIIKTNLKALRSAEVKAVEKNWNLTGTGELTRNMQGNRHLKDLTQIIINHLATYLKAQMGAIYIMEESNDRLTLMSSFAADKKRVISEVIRVGEGIVGQTAAERRMLLISDVPDNYHVIDTGFGMILPKNIIAIPFIFEDRVIGVIELGTIHEFTELQKDYLLLSANSIAIAVISAQAREKTRDLLEETQRQAEELEAQQEELRQTNDKLHTKTELLEQSEEELRAQQDELQQINIELEEKANMLEEQKSRLENAKAEIENKAREVEVTSKYKSEFLANMSHELRTPLNSILILSQLLAENKNNRLGGKELDYARNIHNSGTDLLNLINEILDLSKVEAGKLELDISPTAVHSIVENTSTVFDEIAKNKSVSFHLQVAQGLHNLSITTDPQRVQQILRNLLSNAFKFTEGGGSVTLSVGHPTANINFEHQNLIKADKVICFSVSDTGIGIPKEKQEIIFQAFQQADGSTKRKYGGTGLGLSISRELAHVLGGEIHLHSEEGQGSTFTLYLPQHFDASQIVSERQVEIREPEQRHRTDTPDVAGTVNYPQENVTDDRLNIAKTDKVILIIEDDLPFALVLLDFVRNRGYKGIIATQGNSGISYARHYKPDAILLDIKLPVMDGMEVLRQIKNDAALRHIPVQIISSHDKKKEGLEQGALDYIHKPVSTADLQKAFEKIEKFKNASLKKLLIVEDNKEQNKAIRELIGNGDVKSYSAYSGAEADLLLNTEGFDCIIVDLGLPDMSGFDLLEKIKENEKLNKIPVIVYTGKDLKREDNVRLNKLADTVVLKTVESQERLLDETMLFLHRLESRLPKEKQNIIRKLHSDDVLKGKKILLVDDDIRNIYSLTNALEEEGLECLVAENGKIALETLKTNPDIDLVLMDIMMPEMDGYEATMAIRKIEPLKKLPIIALTAKAMKGDRERCLAVGMSDYISKPVHVDQLLSLMRVWLYR
jgi:CheY-like chemotaxis protein/CHASE3 domain sensor protein